MIFEVRLIQKRVCYFVQPQVRYFREFSTRILFLNFTV
jgi:hypothetical protein